MEKSLSCLTILNGCPLFKGRYEAYAAIWSEKDLGIERIKGAWRHRSIQDSNCLTCATSSFGTLDCTRGTPLC